MLTTRIVAGNDSAFSYVRIKYGNHTTDTVTGVIIYPDDFSFADAGAPMLPFGAYAPVQIEKADWEAFEAWGCVFLPCARNRLYTSGEPSISAAGFGLYGYYYSSTALSAKEVSGVQFASNENVIKTTINRSRYEGLSVRLVQDYR